MPPRRPHPDDGGQNDGPARQRIRSTSGAPVAVRPPAGGPAAQSQQAQQVSIQAQIAAAKAKAAAALAATRNASKGGASLSSPVCATPAAANARPQAPAASAPATSAPAPNDIAARIAAAKAKISRITGSAGVPQARLPPSAPVREERPTGIHPLLLQGNKSQPAPSSMKPMAPRFSTVRANAQAATQKRPGFPSSPAPPEANPYLAAAEEVTAEGSSAPKGRSMHRGFHFARPGRHIAEAEEMRREAQLEEIKKRIAESAKKAGLDGTGEERVLKKQQPPQVEWWDLQFVPQGVEGYEGVHIADATIVKKEPELNGVFKGKGKAQDSDLPLPLIEGDGSPIDIYIQHPIPIPPPGDKDKVPMRGVMLTKKEMKKMRRMRRQAEIQDKRDRIKMGLLPPPPPKVKLSNIMRVLTSEAVADPTKIEARVRREVAARKEAHERMNEERKLTPDERRAKAEMQREKDELKGLSCLVFKIKHLVSPSHKFKIRKNAQQLGLTGITVFSPNFALVIVEGGAKAIKAYLKLMTHRINWTDPGRPKDASDDEGDVSATPSVTDAPGSAAPGTKESTQEEIEHIDWSYNTCDLIFEGPIRERTWQNGFRGRGVETDAEAKEMLGNRASLWDVAKRWSTAAEEV
ncbi:PRP3-domain-containing protein [Tilletiaria anomala UBC 951]|uniref:PRP3-domain-containing protein n=1 Tax=Tilletiaria anomala (strain ATCC 24038 / CBS 436.72 / UBC 951) TaxID=1037660 RepID=A0A066WBK8_TILAU|nr:PRP3-domain-containing protein [Tilletiaria anomala UBC 951]KDN48469.1 PRP3-domain-containing protein [Tilletiaria anomala UBC 951]